MRELPIIGQELVLVVSTETIGEDYYILCIFYPVDYLSLCSLDFLS
jgi:hypothetical protein